MRVEREMKLRRAFPWRRPPPALASSLMEIVFLGTGCPVVSTERYGPAQLVVADGAKILVDCGSGVTQRLVAAGTPGRELDALLLTQDRKSTRLNSSH